jgi:hypothetical protein
MKRIQLTLGAALLFVASVAVAQPYTVDWWTVNGGGGTSTGGPYTVSGTIGQPDAGALSGGVSGGGFPGAPGFSRVRGAVERREPLQRFSAVGSR